MQKININWSQVATSLILGAILGAYGLLRISDSLTIRVTAVENDNTEIKTNLVPRSEFELFRSNTETNFADVKNQLNRMESKL